MPNVYYRKLLNEVFIRGIWRIDQSMLRHTYITHLVENGMDISVVRIIAGHKHITTTQKYTHISNKYLEDSLSKYCQSSSLLGGCFFYNCPNYITEVKFYRVLKQELELMEREMARFKELGREREVCKTQISKTIS